MSEMMKCAAMELFLFKTLSYTSTHLCPVWNLNEHAMCGEICEEASIQFHTTCFKCFAKYGVAFKDPDAFHDAGLQPSRAKKTLAVPQQKQITAHAEGSVHGAGVEVGACGAATALLEIDMYKVGVNDSAVVKLDKKNKRKEFIKTLTLSHFN
jgi:hypothetical protein